MKTRRLRAMNKPQIEQAIVVEGRDDVEVVSRAVEALIIPTHGFGITAGTWELIDRAYREKGIIILTDPDFSGEEIRRKLSARFPDALQAYIPRQLATRKGDIGVENAAPEDVAEALFAARATLREKSCEVTERDFVRLGLSGAAGASEMRERVAARLGIGYGNSKAMCRMINGYGISLEELERAVEWAERK